LAELQSISVPTQRQASISEWSQLQWSSIQSWLSPILRDAPLEITLVGDVDYAEAYNNLTTYWGSQAHQRRSVPIISNYSDTQRLIVVPSMITGQYQLVVNWFADSLLWVWWPYHE
jgi:hypothetical protein